MKTKHTPGPWEVYTFETILGKEVHRVKAPKALEVIGDFKKEDAQLIAAAPDMIKELENTYRDIQILVQLQVKQTGSVILALKTDSIRARLRNTIANATGEDCQKLQERIEFEALATIQVKHPSYPKAWNVDL